MKILLTGADGFIGSKLSLTLKKKNHILFDFKGEIRNPNEIQSFVKQHQSEAEAIIHLAGIGHPPACEKDPKAAHEINVTGTENLLRALKDLPQPLPILFPSTAQVYAFSNDPDNLTKKPVLTENHPVDPKNVYAQTKWDAEQLFHQKDLLGKNSAIILRIFNHTHKSQSADFFLPGIYQQLLKIKTSHNKEITTGNTDLYRDIGAIQDLMAALTVITEKSSDFKGVEIFNICSGTAKNLKTLVLNLARKLDVQPHLKTDPSRVRKNEPIWVCGSFKKTQKQFDWAPRYQTEEELIEAFLQE